MQCGGFAAISVDHHVALRDRNGGLACWVPPSDATPDVCLQTASRSHKGEAARLFPQLVALLADGRCLRAESAEGSVRWPAL
eukprot:9535741-Lingulodinium_polyedra.AAC.1